MAFNVFTRRVGAPYDPDDLTRELNENFAVTAEVSLGTLSGDEILIYDPTAGVFIDTTVPAAVALASVGDLGDVTLATLADEEILLYNASASTFENVTLPAALATVAGYATTINSQTGTTYTLTDADLAGNVIIEANNAGAISLDIPTGLTGTEPVKVIQMGAGAVTVSGDTGVTVNSRGSLFDTNGQYAVIEIIPRGSDNYIVAGDRV